MEKFTFVNKDRSSIKVFEPFEDSSKQSSMINIKYFFLITAPNNN